MQTVDRPGRFLKTIAVIVAVVFFWDQLVWAGGLADRLAAYNNDPSSATMTSEDLAASQVNAQSHIDTRNAIEDYFPVVGPETPHGLQYDSMDENSDGWTYFYLGTVVQEKIYSDGRAYVYKERYENCKEKVTEYYKTNGDLDKIVEDRYDDNWNFSGRTITFSNGKSYEQDGNRQTTKITHTDGTYLTYERHDGGRIQKRIYSNGMVEEFSDEDWNGRDFGKLIKKTVSSYKCYTYSDYFSGTDQARYITDSNWGMSYTYEYDITGFLLSKRRCDGLTEYYYVPSGRLERFVGPDGSYRLYRDEDWNGSGQGRLTQWTRHATTTIYEAYFEGTDYARYEKECGGGTGLREIREYDIEGYLIAVEKYGYSNYTFGVYLGTVYYSYYKPSGRLKSETFIDGTIEEYSDEDWLRTGKGALVKKTLPDGRSTTYGSYYEGTEQAIYVREYDTQGKIIEENEYTIDGILVATSTYEYGLDERLLRCVNSDSTYIKYFYDITGEWDSYHVYLTSGIIEVFDTEDNLIYEYDPLVEVIAPDPDSLVSVTNSNGDIIRYFDGQIVSVTLVQDGSTINNIELDIEGKLKNAIISYLDGSRGLVYDGMLLQKMLATGAFIRYDEEGRVTTEYSEDTGLSVYYYIADETGTVLNIQTVGDEGRCTYDTAGAPVRFEKTNWEVTEYENGHIARLVTAEGQEYLYQYISDGDSFRSELIGSATETYIPVVIHYSADGQVLEVYNSAGNRLTYEDGGISIVTSLGTASINVADDGVGLINEIVVERDGVLRRYDTEGNLANLITADDLVVNLDRGGVLSSVVNNDGVEFLFADDELSLIIDEEGVEYSLDDQDRISHAVHPDGREYDYVYDTDGNVNPIVIVVDLQTGASRYYREDILYYQINDLNLESFYEYDAQGALRKFTQKKGAKTVNHYTYISTEDGGTIIEDLGGELRIYDADGVLQEFHDTEGHVYRFYHNDNGEMISELAELHKEDGRIIYYSEGAVDYVENPTGTVLTNIEFNDEGILRRFTVVLPAGTTRTCFVDGEWAEIVTDDGTKLIYKGYRLAAVNTKGRVLRFLEDQWPESITVEEYDPAPLEFDSIRNGCSWTRQTYQDSLGFSSHTYNSANDQIVINAALNGTQYGYKQGECYLDLQYYASGVSGPLSLKDQEISFLIKLPEGALADGNPLVAQVFAKDAGWKSQYGTEVTLTTDGAWYRVSLVPSDTTYAWGVKDPGFNPENIRLIGFRIKTPYYNNSIYNGQILVKDGNVFEIPDGDRYIETPFLVNKESVEPYVGSLPDLQPDPGNPNYISWEGIRTYMDPGEMSEIGLLDIKSGDWRAQDIDYISGIRSLVRDNSNDQWVADTVLRAGDVSYNHGEMFVDLRYDIPGYNYAGPVDLRGKELEFKVKIPEQLIPSEGEPCWAQVFVKDEEYDFQYGTSVFLSDADTWYTVRLRPGSSYILGGETSEGFDPCRIVNIGVKISCGLGSNLDIGRITKEKITAVTPFTDILWNDLLINGYIDHSGKTQDKVKALAGVEDLTLDHSYAGQEEAIFNLLQQTYQGGEVLVKCETPPSVFSENAPKLQIDVNGLKQYAVENDLVLTFEELLGPEVQLAKEQLPNYFKDDSWTMMTTFDAEGKIICALKGNMRVEHFDEDGRLVEITDPEWDSVVTYSYDDSGNIIDIDYEGTRIRTRNAIQKAKTEIETKTDQALIDLAEAKNGALQYVKDNIESQIAACNRAEQQLQSQLNSVNSWNPFWSWDRKKKNSIRGDIERQLQQVRDTRRDLVRAAAEAYEQIDEDIASSKASIEAEYSTAMSMVLEREENAEREILKQEVEQLLNIYYMKILGRNPGRDEVASWLDVASGQGCLDPDNRIVFDVSVLREALLTSQEYEDRNTFNTGVRESVASFLNDYLDVGTTEIARLAMLETLGLTLAEIDMLNEALWGIKDVEVITKWLAETSINFGRCAFETAQNFLQGKGVVEDLSNIARDLILIDILAGAIDCFTEGALEISLYAMNRYINKHLEGTGTVTYNAKTDFDDLAGIVQGGEDVIVHLNGDHFIIITDIDAEGNVTYFETNNGTAGEAITVNNVDFRMQWSGYVISERAPPVGHEVSAQEALSVKGNFLEWIFLGLAIISAALSFIDNEICQTISKMLGVASLVLSIFTVVVSLPTILETFFTNIANAGNMVSETLKSGFSVLSNSFTGLMENLPALALNTISAISYNIALTQGMSFLNINADIARLTASFFTGGFMVEGFLMNGIELTGNFMPGALVAVMNTGISIFGRETGLDPYITDLLSTSACALGLSFFSGGITAVAESLQTTIIPNVVSELAYIGIQELGEALGLDSRISYLAGIGIRSSLRSGLGTFGLGGGSPGDMWDAARNGMVRGITSVGLQWGAQELGISPLMASLITTAGVGALEGVLEVRNPLIGIYDAYFKAGTGFLTLGGTGETPWEQAAYIAQVLDFSEITKEKGIVEALETYATGFLHQTTIDSIWKLGGVYDLLMNQDQIEFVTQPDGTEAKRIYTNEGKTDYIELALDDDRLIGKREGNIVMHCEFVKGPDGQFKLKNGDIDVYSDGGTKIIRQEAIRDFKLVRVFRYGDNGQLMDEIYQVDAESIQIDSTGRVTHGRRFNLMDNVTTDYVNGDVKSLEINRNYIPTDTERQEYLIVGYTDEEISSFKITHIYDSYETAHEVKSIISDDNGNIMTTTLDNNRVQSIWENAVKIMSNGISETHITLDRDKGVANIDMSLTYLAMPDVEVEQEILMQAYDLARYIVGNHTDWHMAITDAIPEVGSMIVNNDAQFVYIAGINDTGKDVSELEYMKTSLKTDKTVVVGHSAGTETAIMSAFAAKAEKYIIVSPRMKPEKFYAIMQESGVFPSQVIIVSAKGDFWNWGGSYFDHAPNSWTSVYIENGPGVDILNPKSSHSVPIDGWLSGKEYSIRIDGGELLEGQKLADIYSGEVNK
ncbi:MAG: hypothetical protein P9L88_02845 [Candidatus Tantalella remota]|nr:hypothetical protein [Candidatus Tantalella remota]